MADQNILTFKRIEKKYMIPPEKYEELRRRMEPYMQVDEYGLSTIANIYYDTDNFDLIRTSLMKPVYKEKLRLRSYGTPKDKTKVFVEIKKKYDGVVYKRRVKMPLQTAVHFLDEGIYPSEEDCQILHEIDYFLKFYRPKPKLMLAYDRIAMFGKQDPSFRLTFDEKIRSRWHDLDLRHGTQGEELLPPGTHLMEVKINGAMPLWLSSILTDMEIYPVSFSKYGEIYKLKCKNQIDGGAKS